MKLLLAKDSFGVLEIVGVFEDNLSKDRFKEVLEYKGFSMDLEIGINKKIDGLFYMWFNVDVIK